MNLELYYFPECPFCQRVLRKIETLELKDRIALKNIRQDAEAREYHIQKTGRQTVPCLYIDDTPMFESTDICDWLEENKANF